MARHETLRKWSRSQIRKLMRKLNAKQKEELWDLVGPAMDIDRIPDAMWDQWEREVNEGFASVIGLVFLTVWDRIRSVLPFDWFGWPIQKRGEDLAEEYAKERSDFFGKSYVENTRKTISQSPTDDRDTAVRRVFGKDREEIVAVTETSTVIPAAERDYAKEAERKNPNAKLVATWKHHDFRPPGHSRAEINPCPVCSPLEGLREKDWPTKFATGPPAHPNCDCHLEWEIVIEKQNE